jgi:signal transduction histidine kinase
MGSRPLTLRAGLLLALAYVLVLAVVALEVPLALSLRDRVDAEVTSQARSQAEVVAATVSGDLDQPRSLANTAATAAQTVRGRVVIVGRDGALLADSAGTDRLGTDYGNRPEIARALRTGKPVREQRRSETLDQEILVTAVPIVENGARVGAVRITQSVDAVTRATRRATLGLAAIGVLVLLLGLAAGIVIARQIAGPLRRLDDAAARVAEGDLTVRARVEGSAEQRSLARTFNGMTARLERLVAGQRDFVADASHQLRTPLSGLRLRLEEAHAAGADPDVHEELEAAMGELDRLAAIISELLLLSQAGEVDAPPEELDLDDAARRAAARHHGTQGGSVTAVEAAAGSPAFAPMADLDRVLDALIENALRYGGREVTVVARPGGIEVLDRGPGLDAEELDTVFERFHRGRAGRAGPAGTGLGLPIARELARRWGGDVELANRADGGAAARITVPAPPRARFPVS